MLPSVSSKSRKDLNANQKLPKTRKKTKTAMRITSQWRTRPRGTILETLPRLLLCRDPVKKRGIVSGGDREKEKQRLALLGELPPKTANGIEAKLMACFALYVWRLGLMTVIIISVVCLVVTYTACLASRDGCSSKRRMQCPHCNQRCTLKDVRKLFASRVVTVDVESQKRIRQLEATCAALEKKDAGWKKKECEWKNKEAGSESEIQKLRQKVSQLKERTIYLEHLLEEVQNRSIESAEVGWGCQGYFTSGGSNGLELQTERSSRTFEQQMELLMEGARLFDVSASYQMLLVSRRLPGMAVRDALTKISLMNPREVEDVLLPSKTKAVKDLHISPCDGGLVLFASLGKSLAVLSLESNNIVLDYDLPAAAWSCSWDFHRSHYIYAGLQNGTLMVFDMRQTVKPVESLNGLSSNPIHTIQSLSQKNTDGPRSILTASSIGLSLWNVDCREERPTLVPESADEGVCISLACSPNGDDIVATYRPKIDMSTEVTPTQPSANPSPISGQVTQGSHVLFKRSAGSNFLRKSGSMYANVSDIRLPRSAIVGSENQNRFFAFGDEATNEVALQELPSFSTSQRNQLGGFSGWHNDFEIVVEELSFVQNQKSEVALYSEYSFLASISPMAKSSWEAVTLCSENYLPFGLYESRQATL
ncbi:E3 ubiquitin-protein ligase RFWD3-like isoform X2 [Punica granatum]|uniref:RING-type E3 ubiquitin transferase n=1 Tax=Punica granatum TaxID=22663 RepID=A0A6P8DN78_PUNGR|nr:E3 ubiquitin-protein ligase RFWD3-like isoform X2 [Punica granatum]